MYFNSMEEMVEDNSSKFWTGSYIKDWVKCVLLTEFRNRSDWELGSSPVMYIISYVYHVNSVEDGWLVEKKNKLTLCSWP